MPRLCNNPAITFDHARHLAREKLLPLIQAACPNHGTGAGGTACNVVVERDGAGVLQWHFVCGDTGKCPHQSGAVEWCRKLKATDLHCDTIAIACSISEDNPYTKAECAGAKLIRCDVLNVDLLDVEQLNVRMRHARTEIVDGKVTGKLIPVTKDKDGKIVDVKEVSP